MSGIVHIAGYQVRVNQLLRQRCAWCTVVLIDYDLDRVAVPVGQDPTPATWPPGELVEVDGNASWIVPHEDGQQLPAQACANLDAAVTV